MSDTTTPDPVLAFASRLENAANESAARLVLVARIIDQHVNQSSEDPEYPNDPATWDVKGYDLTLALEQLTAVRALLLEALNDERRRQLDDRLLAQMAGEAQRWREQNAQQEAERA